MEKQNKNLDNPLSDVMDSKLTCCEFQLKRVYDWLIDESREPAQTKFTAGWQRNLAKEIEIRLRKVL